MGVSRAIAQTAQSFFRTKVNPLNANEAAGNVVSYLLAPGNVLRYGADPTGVADSTTAIRNAVAAGVAVYFPAGTYKVTDAITLAFADQRLYGDGFQSIIKAAATFNLAATGVFVAAGVGNPDHGPWFENLRLTCDQSGVAVAGTRANLIKYPPALYLRNSPRFRFLNVRIDQFTYGIDAQGPMAGAVISGLEIGCYSCGLAVDGNGDTFRINDFHYIWFNEWTANQMAIITDGNSIGISCGRMDGLDVVDSLFFTATKGIRSFLGNGNNQVTDPVTGQSLAGNGGTPWLTGFTTGQITNCGFDTYSGIFQSAAGSWLMVSNCYFAAGVAAAQAVVVTQGEVRLTGCFFNINLALTNPYCVFSNAVANEVRGSLVNCSFLTNFDTTAISGSGNNPVELHVCDCVFTYAANVTNAKAIVDWTNSNASGGLHFSNNKYTPKGAGTGNGLSLAQDGNHQVNSNSFNGWGLAAPAVGSVIAYTLAVVANNSPRGALNMNASNAQQFAGVSGGTLAAGSTNFLGPGAAETAGAQQNSYAMAKPGNIVGFTIVTDAVPGGADTFTYTVMLNGVATAMTGIMTSAIFKLNITSNPFAVVLEDSICIRCVSTATAAVCHHKHTLMFEPA